MYCSMQSTMAREPKRAEDSVATLKTCRYTGRCDAYQSSSLSQAGSTLRRKCRRNVGFGKGNKSFVSFGFRNVFALAAFPSFTFLLLCLTAHSASAVDKVSIPYRTNPLGLSSPHRRAQIPRPNSAENGRRRLRESDENGNTGDDEQGDDPLNDDVKVDDTLLDDEAPLEGGDEFTGVDELSTESGGIVDVSNVEVPSTTTIVDAPSNTTLGMDTTSKIKLISLIQPESETETKAFQSDTATAPATPNDQQRNNSVVTHVTSIPATLAPKTEQPALPVAVTKRPVVTPAPKSLRTTTPAPRASPSIQPTKQTSKEEEIYTRDTGLPLPESTPATASVEVLAALFCVAAMIFTAWQMSDNPDGLFASMCRLIITCLQLVYRVIMSPCRKCLPCCFSSQHAGNGYHEPYGHMRVSTMDYGYKDPALELS